MDFSRPANTPKNEIGLTQLIMMGKSIRQIWVKIGIFSYMQEDMCRELETLKHVQEYLLMHVDAAQLHGFYPADYGPQFCYIKV